MQQNMDKNHCKPEDIYDMDETGYAIGTTQSSQVLVVLETGSNRKYYGEGQKVVKKVPGRQEWVTAIECVSATGRISPPLMIFKGQIPYKEQWRPLGMRTED